MDIVLDLQEDLRAVVDIEYLLKNVERVGVSGDREIGIAVLIDRNVFHPCSGDERAEMQLDRTCDGELIVVVENTVAVQIDGEILRDLREFVERPFSVTDKVIEIFDLRVFDYILVEEHDESAADHSEREVADRRELLSLYAEYRISVGIPP